MFVCFSEKAPKQQLKETSTKLSRKKKRLDPDTKADLRVTELQEALAMREEEGERRRKEKQRQEAEEKAKEAATGAEENKEEESSGDEMEELDGGLQDLGETGEPL